MGPGSQRGYRCRSFSVMSLLSDARAVAVRPDPPDREPIAPDAVESSDLSTFHGKRRSPKNVPNFAFASTKLRCTSFELLRKSVESSSAKPSADELNLMSYLVMVRGYRPYGCSVNIRLCIPPSSLRLSISN